MKGLVTEVKNDLAIVKIQRKEACGECRACFSGMTKTDMDIEAKNLCDAEVGDWVELELQDNAFFHAVIIMYGLPFLGMMAGMLLGYYGIPMVVPAISPVLSGVVLAAAGILIVFAWIKSQNPRWESGKYRPFASKIVEEEDEICNGNYMA